MRRRWSFLPLRNADAGSGSGGGAADAGAAAAAGDAGGASAGAATGDAGASAAAAAGTAAAAAPARPDWLPEDQWDAATGKPKVDVAAALQAKAKLDERAGQVPSDAAGYKVELPEGSTLKLDDKDPLLGAFRDFAHKEGFTAAQFNGVLEFLDRRESEAIAAWQVAAEAEVKKLGDKAPERIGTVTQFLSSKLPTAQFEAIRGIVQIAAGVEAVETLMTLASGQKLPGSGPAASEAMSEEAYFKSLFNSK